jgi:uncharacterized protein (TIGR03083 family)
MALLRVDARALVPRLRAELAALLTGLTGGDWALPTACPGWSVHDVAAHLLGVELGNVSVRRDRWGLGPAEGEDLDAWLNRFNQQWVDAARRISPALLIELVDLAGRRFEEHLATLDLDAAGGPVQWATGSDPAPVWLDVAREYMERYVHQQQIRDATGRPPGTHHGAGALKLYARDPSAPPLTWQGDREIAGALAGVKAVLG